MANSGIKQALGQIAQDTGEAIVDPLKDEVGQALEQAAPIITGPKVLPQDPQALVHQKEEQRKRDEENKKKKQWAEAIVERYKKIEEEQAAVRMKQKQAEEKKKQEENQEEQKKMSELKEQQQKSADLTVLEQAARKTEIKGGVGG